MKVEKTITKVISPTNPNNEQKAWWNNQDS